jgi:AsmA protein
VKWLAGIVGALVLLAGLAAGAIALLLDSERVRDELAAAVLAQTGRELRIAEPVELSYFPWLGASLRGVSLGSPPGFGDEPLARVGALRVGVRVLPLLSGRVELGALVLDGLELNLVRDASGAENWRGPTGGAAAAVAGEPAATTPIGSDGRGLAAFLLGGVELTGGRVSWRDQRAGVRHLVDDIALRTGAVAPGLAVPVRFGARLVTETPQRAIRLEGTANLSLGDDYATLAMPDLALTATGQGEGLPAEGVVVDVRAGIRYDLAADSLSLAPVSIATAGLRLTAEAKGTTLTSEPVFDGRIDLAELRPRELLALAGAVPVSTADPAVLGRVAGNLPFRLDGRSAAIDGLNVTVDDTTLQGRVTIADFAGPALRFELNADRLDLDRYLPPASATAGAGTARSAQPQAAGAVVAAGAALPTDALRRLDLDGTLQIGNLKAGGARLSDLRTQWRARSGVITQTAAAALYGGRGEVTSTLDARPAEPAMGVNGALQGVDLAGLLADTAGGGRLSGTGTVEADLRWTGLREALIKKSLNGNLRVALRDGAVHGFNLDGLVQNALAALKGGPRASGPQQTAFSELTASATVRDGVLSNRDLRALSPLLRVTGAGTVDLPANRLDYRAEAVLVDGAQARLGIKVKELEGAVIPVRFTGSLDDPAIHLEVDEVLKGAARHEIERKVEEKLKGEWGDKLKRFFGR